MPTPAEQIREAFKKSDDIRDAGLTTPDDVRRFDDIVYGADPKSQILDVYRPAEAEGRLPVIVSVHGGGWVYGDKERYQYYCMSLARRGFAVVNFTYRLAPENKFPAQLEDTNAVFRFVHDKADEYGFDTGRVFAVGDSAGGHLLGLYSCLCANPEYSKCYDFAPPEGFIPTAVALNCGVYDMTQEYGNPNSLMGELLPDKGTVEELERISVVGHLTKDFPPAFVMTCEGDFLIPQAELLCAALEKLGVEHEYHYYGDKEHVLGHVFHCNMKLEEAAKCNDDECAFFRKYM